MGKSVYPARVAYRTEVAIKFLSGIILFIFSLLLPQLERYVPNSLGCLVRLVLEVWCSQRRTAENPRPIRAESSRRNLRASVH